MFELTTLSQLQEDLKELIKRIQSGENVNVPKRYSTFACLMESIKWSWSSSVTSRQNRVTNARNKD